MNNIYNMCHIEFFSEKWWILYPDGSKAWNTGYKNKGSATRLLTWLIDRKH